MVVRSAVAWSCCVGYSTPDVRRWKMLSSSMYKLPCGLSVQVFDMIVSPRR